MPATSSPSEPPDLQRFGSAARRAVAAAESEARALGHDRVGTEHLLLGVLADDASAAARLLADAGAGLPSVRHKVLEARPQSQPPAAGTGRLELTARAARALGRSVRFSHRRRTQRVTPEDLLIGVLDVEGTAGQVLRSLGLDVDAVRAGLDAGEAPEPDPEPEPASGDRSACPSCGAAIADDLRYRVVPAHGADGPLATRVFSCGACGTVVGAAPA